MITGKLTGRGRVTLPKAVLEALDLQEGDAIAYGIEDRSVTVTKAAFDPFAAFEEWSSPADCEAYADL